MTMTWKTSSGLNGRIEATYSETMERKVYNADGYTIEGDMEPTRAGNCNMVAYIDGKKVDDCWNPEFWALIDTNKPGIKKIWGLNVGFFAEDAAKYEAFVARIIEDGTSDEVKAYRAAQDKKENEDALENAKEIIKKAEAQRDIPTEKEAAERRRAYNDVHNEGGEGYIPTWITREAYDEAKKIVGLNCEG